MFFVQVIDFEPLNTKHYQNKKELYMKIDFPYQIMEVCSPIPEISFEMPMA